MSALTLLLPARTTINSTLQLARWLARGDRLPDAKPGREAQLRECFEFLGASLPAAALTRSLDASDAASALWLRADPCHVAVDAVAVRMLACGDIGLSQDESEELARALRPLFGDAGFPLERATPDRWYLRCPRESKLPRFASPDEVLGDDLLRHLPSGDNERQWRSLFNEAQVILHNHPINIERVRRDLPAANSLWFWGAGMLPEWVRAPYTRVASEDAAAVALAKLAKIAVANAGATLADLSANEALLIDTANATIPGVGDFSSIDLRFSSGERFRYKAWHRWRFWRRVRT